MTTTTRQLIDAMTFDYDLDALGDMLIDYEDDDDAREVIYAAIDHVSQGLALTVDVDAVYTIS